MGYKQNKKLPVWKRPAKPERDRTVFEVLHAIRDMKPTEVNQKTYVSAQTIRNWRNMKVRWPQHHTLSAVAAVAGLEFRLVPKGTNNGSSSKRRRKQGP